MPDRGQKQQLKIPPHVRIRKVHGEALLLDLKTRLSFGLNPVGVAVWQEIEAQGDVETVIENLLAEYDIDRSTLECDVFNLVDELLRHGLLTAASEAES